MLVDEFQKGIKNKYGLHLKYYETYSRYFDGLSRGLKNNIGIFITNFLL